ncbi:MAG: arsenic resistance N-acetyltransferase ArsN2 [Gemmatimonadales bacterium]
MSDLKATLRGAHSNDLPAIERLLSMHRLPLVGVREGIAGFMVAEEDGALAGVIGLEVRGGYGLLRSAAVAPDHQGKGVGRALVARVLAEARVRKLKAVYLLTTTAEGYFPVFGFAVTDRAAAPKEMQTTAEFAGACDATAVAMVLTLSGE